MYIRAAAIPCLLAVSLIAQLGAQPVPQPQSTGGQLDANPALFTVLAAMNAAGYDADLESTANHPLRKAARDYIAKKNPPSIAQLKNFFAGHRQKDPAQELSQYVSLALCLTAPPELEIAHPERPLPPDAAPLADLVPLLRNFYQEANLESAWRQSQPAIDQLLAKYQEPVSRIVMQTNGYLRVPSGSAFLGRKFQIYLDVLGAPHQIHTRSYGDDTFLVLTPTYDPPVEEIRRIYLQYLLDPLVTKFSENVGKKRGLSDYAQGSPILDQHYKDDFVLLTTASLVRAVESRLAPTGQRQAMVDRALKEGFVVTPALAELLPAYEKQDRAMRLYMPEMINAIDLKHEAKRLEKIDFASERPTRRIKVPTSASEPVPVLTGAAKGLEEAEKLYQDRNLPGARDAYVNVLQQTEDKPLHAKAYYGLARIAALSGDPELAEKLFRKVIEIGGEAETRSWSLLYLARLADNKENGRQEAETFYRAALSVEGAPDSVKQAAEKGLKEAFVGKKPNE